MQKLIVVFPLFHFSKALDVWMLMCISFIFLSLGEFTIVLKLRSMKEKKPSETKSSQFRRL